ncbi:casein kinase I isoform X2 [Folsomia candida]|uniref:non-specific serine/threonine protein kinase n=2 Tax=Folsomia candida TaxID=158441 RepID=A0A226D066_FOLCA|nr:casein kinase I isoform X2 [Folsomia candida]OXA38975.1 Casein kinase I isoform alpha [Folsomia candida]
MFKAGSMLDGGLTFHEISVGQFHLVRRIASGGFGELYLAIDPRTLINFAAKLERTSTKHSLDHENAVYKLLEGEESIGIPKIWWFGQMGKRNALVMDLLGPSLSDLFELCEKRFCVKTVLLLADQMIAILQYIHSKGIVHRDIKPDNFLMGVGDKCDQVHLVDFGLSNRFLDSQGQHTPYTEGNPMAGTARYASINAHTGIEPSRRDDLESLGYLLVYFLKKGLPWQNMKARDRTRLYKKIYDMKSSMGPKTLCKGLPDEFEKYLDYCLGLGFDETPDYEYLAQLFRTLAQELGHEYDFFFDWNILAMMAM